VCCDMWSTDCLLLLPSPQPPPPPHAHQRQPHCHSHPLPSIVPHAGRGCCRRRTSEVSTCTTATAPARWNLPPPSCPSGGGCTLRTAQHRHERAQPVLCTAQYRPRARVGGCAAAQDPNLGMNVSPSMSRYPECHVPCPPPSLLQVVWRQCVAAQWPPLRDWGHGAHRATWGQRTRDQGLW
jgi:hypothetical protein